MIEINLLPESLRRKETPRIAMPAIPIKKSLFLFGGIAVLIQLLLTLAAMYMRFELISVDRKITVARQQNRDIVKQKAETTGIYNRLKEMRSLTDRKFFWTSLLSELSNSMTKGIWLRSLSVVEEQEHAVKIESAPKKDKNAKKENGEKTDKAKKGAKSDKSEKTKEPVKAPDREKYLVLEGTVIGAGQETAFIGKFLKELKDNVFFAQTFKEIKPSNIKQKKIGEYEVYDFMIRCQFKRDKIG